MRERSGIRSGIVMITVGLLFIGDRQGLFSFSRMWPVLLIVLGLTSLLFPKDDCDAGTGRADATGRTRSRVGRGIWMVFVGGLLLADQNHLVLMRDSWPLFVVAGGLAMIFGGRRRRSSNSFGANDGPMNPDGSSIHPSGRSMDTSGRSMSNDAPNGGWR